MVSQWTPKPMPFGIRGSPGSRRPLLTNTGCRVCSEAGIFLDKLQDMMKFLIPNYIKEGKNQLVVAIGCTGGKHRSVTLANGLYRALLSADESVRIEHRDIEKDAVTKG